MKSTIRSLEWRLSLSYFINITLEMSTQNEQYRPCKAESFSLYSVANVVQWHTWPMLFLFVVNASLAIFQRLFSKACFVPSWAQRMFSVDTNVAWVLFLSNIVSKQQLRFFFDVMCHLSYWFWGVKVQLWILLSNLNYKKLYTACYRPWFCDKYKPCSIYWVLRFWSTK